MSGRLGLAAVQPPGALRQYGSPAVWRRRLPGFSAVYLPSRSQDFRRSDAGGCPAFRQFVLLPAVRLFGKLVSRLPGRGDCPAIPQSLIRPAVWLPGSSALVSVRFSGSLSSFRPTGFLAPLRWRLRGYPAVCHFSGRLDYRPSGLGGCPAIRQGVFFLGRLALRQSVSSQAVWIPGCPSPASVRSFGSASSFQRTRSPAVWPRRSSGYPAVYRLSGSLYGLLVACTSDCLSPAAVGLPGSLFFFRHSGLPAACFWRLPGFSAVSLPLAAWLAGGLDSRPSASGRLSSFRQPL